MLLLIDNYDSFVYNLYQILAQLVPCRVIRNDQLSCAELLALQPQAVVLSPGPGHPQAAGVCLELVAAAAAQRLPLLGVCLGHQALACALGGSLMPAPELMHGKVSAITHHSQGLFAGLPQPLAVARYHSLVVDPGTLPAELEVTARSADQTIMALQHRHLPLFGLQFHPESLATPQGPALIHHFLDQVGLEPVAEVA